MRHAIIPPLLLVALLGTACAHTPAVSALVRPSAAAHAQATSRGGFQDLNGQSVSPSDFQGSPVVLAFLSPDDTDSEAEVPLLLRLAGAYASYGVTMVAVGEHASNAAMQAFGTSAGITFPIWNDPTGAEAARRGFTHLPAFQFIDRNGGVTSAHQGFMSRGQLTAAIEDMLALRK